MKRKPLTVWAIIAIVVTLVGALTISSVPLGVGSAALPWPNLTLCVVFFWMIHRPSGLPTLAVLAVGLMSDLIGGGVIGAGMLALLVCTAFLRSGADALERSAFGLRWMAFVGFAAGVYLIEGLLTALPRWTIPPIGAAFAQFLVTVLAYALVSVLFRKVLRIGRT